MATTFLEKSQSAGNTQTWTMSMWIKTSVTNDEQPLFSSASDSNNQDLVYIEAGGNLRWWTYQSAAYVGQLQTNRLLRDANAWYHLVFVFDSTNATADDRMRIYINGVQETSFAARNNPAQNSNTLWNGSLDQRIAQDAAGQYVDEFDGSMSHINFIDGTAYEPTAFGEYDANGVWKIIVEPSVTYGTNGFFILKNGNSVTDQSGNSNNFTVQASGTLTKTEDSPSNVFATQNPLNFISSGCNLTLENGNTTVSNGCAVGNVSTLGASSGKYYWEGKLISYTNTGGGTDKYQIGINGTIFSTNTQFTGSSNPYGYSYLGTGNKGNNGTESSFGDTYTINDIIGVALDLDNNKLYFSKNGVWQNSGDPTSGATGTGSAYTITTASSTDSGFYFACCGHKDNLAKWSMNFGNGYFGTTAVASAGTNASGNGIFEYDVPTGYTALSTKGLNL